VGDYKYETEMAVMNYSTEQSQFSGPRFFDFP